MTALFHLSTSLGTKNPESRGVINPSPRRGPERFQRAEGLGCIPGLWGLVDKMSYGAGPGDLSVCRPLGGFTRLQLRD